MAPCDPALHLDERRRPLCLVCVGAIQPIQVDEEIAGVAPDGEPVHVARRTALDEHAVGPVFRLVPRALEPAVARSPPQGGVLVWARRWWNRPGDYSA